MLDTWQIDNMSLLNHDDQERIEVILKYVEAGDLRQWNLPNIKAFYIGLREFRSKLNCITNPLMYQQVQAIYINLLHFFTSLEVQHH